LAPASISMASAWARKPQRSLNKTSSFSSSLIAKSSRNPRSVCRHVTSRAATSKINAQNTVSRVLDLIRPQH
jgi:hypothetical protein